MRFSLILGIQFDECKVESVNIHTLNFTINKYFRLILLGIALCLFAFPTAIDAQIYSEAMALEQLKEKGLTEEEVRTALVERGLNIDEIDPDDPASLIEAEKTIRAVIEELSSKKRMAKADERKEEGTVETIKIEEEKPVLLEEPDTVVEAREINEIYGHHIFKKEGFKIYNSIDDHIPGENYIIGPGDQIAISIWGLSDQSYSTIVTNQGFISARNIRIYVSGLKLKDARTLIIQRLRNIHTFRNDEIDINLSVARKININVVGEVKTSGAYNISAVNNAIGAISAAGGPTDIGSIRKIRLIRSGQNPINIDLYAYLTNPTIAEDYTLTNNDFINIAPAELIVQVNGAVRRPLKYELLSTESLAQVIQYAGGFSPDAYRGSIEIERIEGSNKIVMDVDFNDANTVKLQDGDIIRVKRIKDRLDNLVSISGAVDNPGNFAYSTGLTVSSIIEKAILSPDARRDVAVIKKKNADQKTFSYKMINLEAAILNPNSSSDIAIESGDEIRIYSTKDYVDNYSVFIDGPVRSPGEYPLDNGGELKISDLIFLAGGLERELSEYGFIYRQKPGVEKTLSYIRVNLNEILSNPSSSENAILEPNDRLILKDQEFYNEESSVTVGGAVKAPGVFKYSPTLNISDIIMLAGGLKREADAMRVDIYRLNFGENKATETTVANIRLDEDGIPAAGDFPLLPFDKIYVRYASEYELISMVEINGEVKFPGEYGLVSNNPRLSSLVTQSGNLTEEAFLDGATLYRSLDDVGYIIIDMKKAIENPGSSYDVILKRGDYIEIPKFKSYVSIEGATNIREEYSEKIAVDGKVNVIFEEGKRAKYYITQYAGGFDKNADKKRTVVMYSNGQIKRAKSFAFFTQYPKVEEGSVISVPIKPIEEIKEKDEDKTDWSAVLNKTIAQVTSILTLILLANNLN